MSKIEFGKAKDATLGQCCQEDEKLGRWKRSLKRKSFSNLFSIPPRFCGVHWFYSRGEKTFYALGSLMDILLMGTSIITAPIILCGAITVSSQWNQNKPEIWKIHLPQRENNISSGGFTVDGLRTRILSMTPQPEPLKWFDSSTNLKIQTKWMAWSIIGGTLREGRGPK